MNEHRFDGIADVYDRARPTLPTSAVEIVRRYLDGKLETAVDMGCGTGLSSRVWCAACRRVIGVEPNRDMIKAAATDKPQNFELVCAFGNDTGLADGVADAVICSQAFHWTEPHSTLREVARILRVGGVFATVDYDWPPSTRLAAETAYVKLAKTVKEKMSAPEHRIDKNEYLRLLKDSGLFRYTREILFSNTETYTAEKLYEAALSQSTTKSAMENSPIETATALAEYRAALFAAFGNEPFEAHISYRVRLGVK